MGTGLPSRILGRRFAGSGNAADTVEGDRAFSFDFSRDKESALSSPDRADFLCGPLIFEIRIDLGSATSRLIKDYLADSASACCRSNATRSPLIRMMLRVISSWPVQSYFS